MRCALLPQSARSLSLLDRARPARGEGAVLSILIEPGLALVADAVDQHLLGRCSVLVQCDVARAAARDQELVEAGFGRPADQGMLLEDAEGFLDEASRSLRVLGTHLPQEARESLEVCDGGAGVRNRRHGAFTGGA